MGFYEDEVRRVMRGENVDVTEPSGPINAPSPEAYGELQSLIDTVYLRSEKADSLQLVAQAEIVDVHPDVLEVVNLLPFGTYTRPRMCDQLNSIITAHGWGARYGTVA